MALLDMMSDDDRAQEAAGSKGTKPSQSTKMAGPAGKTVVGKSGMPKKDGSKDTVSPQSTKRGKTTVGKSSGKSASNPRIVTPQKTSRKK